MSDEAWEDLRNTPGFSGDEEFDRAMLAFQAEVAAAAEDAESEDAGEYALRGASSADEA